MNQPTGQADEFADLPGMILALVDGKLDRAEQIRLEELMLGNSEARRVYLETMRLQSAPDQCAGLQAEPVLLDESFDENDDNDMHLSDALILPALEDRQDEPEEEVQAPPAIEPERPAARTRETSAQHVWDAMMFWRRGRAGWMIAAAASVLLAASAVVLYVTSQAPAATAFCSADAQFDGTGLGASRQNPINAGKSVKLLTGCVELKFAGGADVVVEAPASFSVTNAVKMKLDDGRISAVAAGAAHGFVVDTPTTRVTDLGTQFGINVTPAGITEVQVFEGQVAVAAPHAPNAPTSSDPPVKLTTGQAVVVADGAIKMSPDGATPQAFVRSLSAPGSIDMVDLICGGDGTTHLRSGAIDQRTGHVGNLTLFKHVVPVSQPVHAKDIGSEGSIRTFGGDVKPPDYHTVSKLPVIDGCFVPNGNDKVDSANHTFDFGATDQTTFYEIRAGGTFPWPRPDETFTAVLGGVDYSQPEHGLILLHPNVGITFDLAVLHRLHPGLSLADFRAVVGNTCPDATPGTKAHVFVLVDGVQRFDRPWLGQNDGVPVNINVPLTDSDRFLTVVTTNQGKSTRFNWIILGDPRLE